LGKKIQESLCGGKKGGGSLIKEREKGFLKFGSTLGRNIISGEGGKREDKGKREDREAAGGGRQKDTSQKGLARGNIGGKIGNFTGNQLGRDLFQRIHRALLRGEKNRLIKEGGKKGMVCNCAVKVAHPETEGKLRLEREKGRSREKASGHSSSRKRGGESNCQTGSHFHVKGKNGSRTALEREGRKAGHNWINTGKGNKVPFYGPCRRGRGGRVSVK